MGVGATSVQNLPPSDGLHKPTRVFICGDGWGRPPALKVATPLLPVCKSWSRLAVRKHFPGIRYVDLVNLTFNLLTVSVLVM